MEVSVAMVMRSRGRVDKCDAIWGQNLHVWQRLVGPACLAVGWFTACWMDMGTVVCGASSADLCLAVFYSDCSSSLELHTWETKVRAQNFFVVVFLSWVFPARMEFPCSSLIREVCLSICLSQLWRMAVVLNTSFYKLGFCSKLTNHCYFQLPDWKLVVCNSH